MNNETETAIRVQILQMKSRSDLFSPMSKKKTFYKEKPVDERSKGRNEPDSFNEACAGISGKMLSNGTFWRYKHFRVPLQKTNLTVEMSDNILWQENELLNSW